MLIVLVEIIAAFLSQNKLQEVETFQAAITVNFNTLISNVSESLMRDVFIPISYLNI
jgi:uncharacterized protein (DUF2164 family)